MFAALRSLIILSGALNNYLVMALVKGSANSLTQSRWNSFEGIEIIVIIYDKAVSVKLLSGYILLIVSKRYPKPPLVPKWFIDAIKRLEIHCPKRGTQ